jgi:S-adenosylmethionine:tRNA ribosyltransferase-isomerase
VGNKLYFNDAKGNEVLVAEVVDNTTSRGRTIRFFYDGDSEALYENFESIGEYATSKIYQPQCQ